MAGCDVSCEFRRETDMYRHIHSSRKLIRTLVQIFQVWCLKCGMWFKVEKFSLICWWWNMAGYWHIRIFQWGDPPCNEAIHQWCNRLVSLSLSLSLSLLSLHQIIYHNPSLTQVLLWTADTTINKPLKMLVNLLMNYLNWAGLSYPGLCCIIHDELTINWSNWNELLSTTTTN